MSKEQLLKEAMAKRDRDALLAEAQAKRDADLAAQEAAKPGIAEKVETAGRSTLEGMTMGLSEPVIGGANAVIGNLIDSGFDAEDIKDFLSKAVDKERIKKEFDADVSRRRSLESQLPEVAIPAEMGGAILPAFATGGASTLGTAGKAAYEVSQIGTKGAGLLAKGAGAVVEAIPGAKNLLAAKNALGSAARIGKAGLEGAAVAAGSEGVRQIAERPTGYMEQGEGADLGDVALMGGKFGAAVKGVPEMAGLAKKAGKSMLAAFGGVKPEVIDQYIEKGPQVRGALSVPDAKAVVDDAVAKVQADVTAQRGNFTDQVLGAVDDLKQKVVQGSKDAYGILEEADGVVNTATVKRAITEAKKTLQPVPGKAPVGKTAQNAVAALDGYRSTFNTYPKTMTLPQAKKILQQLDDDINYARKAGEFGSRTDNALSQVRSSLDELVKVKSPEYREKMLEVADDTRTLSTMVDKFGTAEGVQAKIDRFGTPKGDMEMQALKTLQKKSGVPLMGPLGEIEQAQPIMRMNENMTQKFMQSIFNNSSIENRKKLGLLSKLSEQDLTTIVENAGVKDAFNKSFNAGSLNVNLWTVIGGGVVGGITGSLGMGTEGAIGGAILGSMVRVYGPKATQKILDGVSKIQGMPTVQKVERFIQDVPPELKERIKNDLIRSVAVPMNATPIVIPKEQYQSMLQDIDSATNINSIEKAKAIDHLHRFNSIPGDTLRKIMLDNGQAQDVSPPLQIGEEKKPVRSDVKLKSITDYIKSKRHEEF